MYFDIDTPSSVSKAFQRNAYQLLGNSEFKLVHYIGKEDVAIDFPHRASKHERPFNRIAPSTMNRLHNLVKDNTPGVVYKKEIASMCCDKEKVPSQSPREMKQLRNLR